jgi:hypothetical protein
VLRCLAAAFEEDDAVPASVVSADAYADADGAESGAVVEGEAGGVLGEDPGSDGPDPGGFGGDDERVQESGITLALGVRVDVDGVLNRSEAHGPGGGGADRVPAQKRAPLSPAADILFCR